MAVSTYDPKKIVVTFAGRLLSGFADGTFLQAERNANTFELTVGAGGEACRVKAADKSGKVTLTLMGSSISNDVLNAIASADELGGSGQGSLLVKDLNGTTIIAAPSAWIEKPPAIEFAKELSNREWVFRCTPLELSAGGNI